jgi:hypothetical protein
MEKIPFCGCYRLPTSHATAPNSLPIIITTAAHALDPDVAASCLSGEIHLRLCARSLATDIGTILPWTGSTVSAALPGGVRNRLFARKPPGGCMGECCNRISTLGVLA